MNSLRSRRPPASEDPPLLASSSLSVPLTLYSGSYEALLHPLPLVSSDPLLLPLDSQLRLAHVPDGQGPSWESCLLQKGLLLLLSHQTLWSRCLFSHSLFSFCLADVPSHLPNYVCPGLMPFYSPASFLGILFLTLLKVPTHHLDGGPPTVFRDPNCASNIHEGASGKLLRIWNCPTRSSYCSPKFSPGLWFLMITSSPSTSLSINSFTRHPI